MKECPICHRVYDDNINFCTIDGSELILKENLRKRLLNLLKSRVFRWSLLSTVAIIFLIHGGYLINTYTENIVVWIWFVAALSFIVGLTILFVSNSKVKMTVLAIAAAVAIGAGMYTIYYFNSATYLRVTPNDIVFSPDQHNGKVSIYIDCDRPWKIVHHPWWTTIRAQYNSCIEVECDNYDMAIGSITIKSGKLVRNIRVTGIEIGNNVKQKKNTKKK